MSQFSYYLVPTVPMAPLYYISLPSMASLDPPPPQTTPSVVTQTTTRIASQTNLASTAQSKSSLQLSREQLLAAGYQKSKKVWSAKEDEKLLQLIGGGVPWKEIHLHMQDRTEKMCYSRYRRLMAQARQRWAAEEEQRLRQLVEQRGEQWKDFVQHFQNRTWKQIRDKYLNYLRPGINKDEWSLAEDMRILELLKRHGTKWKLIQLEMANRTDNQIKNRYYGRLKVLLKRKARRRTRV